jgi:hypothetical protein
MNNQMSKCFKCDTELDTFTGFINGHSYCSDCYYIQMEIEWRKGKVECLKCKKVVSNPYAMTHLKQVHPETHDLVTLYDEKMLKLDKEYSESSEEKQEKLQKKIEQLERSIYRLDNSIYKVVNY